MDINPEKIMGVCEEMRQHFDYIIIDTAGVGSSVFSVIKAAELILMVTTPDTVCVRDGAILSDFLYVKNCTNQRLIINKVSQNFKDEEILYDLDEVMDSVGIQLLGVVPEDNNIKVCGARVCLYLRLVPVLRLMPLSQGEYLGKMYRLLLISTDNIRDGTKS